jgi:hypothetical protein
MVMRAASPVPSRPLLWVIAGVALAIGIWLLLVPWDLSEVDLQGRDIDGGADENWERIAGVLAVIVLVGVLLALVRPWSGVVPLTVAGAASWAGLFAWRASVSRVSGANLWRVSFVMMVVPAALATVILVSRLVRWRRDRRVTAR